MRSAWRLSEALSRPDNVSNSSPGHWRRQSLSSRDYQYDRNIRSLESLLGYITISHHDQSYLARALAGITWGSLPRVFQDAISLTRNLGIEYIWIDPLCIIQGDEVDWTRESSNMVATYSDCYFNIAAASSPGSNGSLFGTGWTTPITYDTDPAELPRRPVKFYTIPFASNKSEVKARYRLKPAHEHVMMLHHSREASDPMSSRKVLYSHEAGHFKSVSFHPESYTSTRARWYGNEAVDCECGEMSEGELGLYDGNLVVGKRWRFELETGPDEGDPTIIYPPLNRWLDGVELYSRLRITDSADRLPAFQGLAARFSDRILAEYLAGHWESDSPRSFCWKVDGEQRDGPETSTLMVFGKRCVPYCTPSWSWASVDLSSTGSATSFEARITFEHLVMTDFLADERFELIDVQCTTGPLSPFGKVTCGSLKIRAPILSTCLYIDNPDIDPDYHIGLPSRFGLGDMDFSHLHLPFRKSKNSSEGFNDLRELRIVLILIGTIEGTTDFTRRILALVLMPMAGLPGKWERIGLLMCPKNTNSTMVSLVRLRFSQVLGDIKVRIYTSAQP
ncbi:hypothetical protein IFR04_006462 [Cadophora malorum]|uniref:Heterokaryon incompatibility domain-containing protein n=1 Tax=Cadophora malorum TaxID=108018 RepID=A0A8H7W7J0_9HELO|nr:hypothetical protein IFR04_006462 [Cadophora malorum]